MEISKSAGVPKDKIVIGKLADKDQGGSGSVTEAKMQDAIELIPSRSFMDIALLSQCMKQAKENGLNGGIMFWKWIPVSSGSVSRGKCSLTSRVWWIL
jgi:hypothetical protein